MSSDFEKMFGEVVGTGAQATVYAKGDYAVKLYREDYPKRNVFGEAYIMANLEPMNFPGPKIYEVLLVNGRYGLRMDRAKGKMMLQDVQDPARCKDALNALVDLQVQLQKSYDKVAAVLPDLKQRFQGDVERNDRLSVDRKKELLEILAGLPEGHAFCHCDFHGGNVFFDGKRYTVIDLLQSSRGDPAADAACSYTAYSLLDRGLGEYYLDRFCAKSGIPATSVRRWLKVYAGTLLGQIPEKYTPMVERFIEGD